MNTSISLPRLFQLLTSVQLVLNVLWVEDVRDVKVLTDHQEETVKEVVSNLLKRERFERGSFLLD